MSARAAYCVFYFRDLLEATAHESIACQCIVIGENSEPSAGLPGHGSLEMAFGRAWWTGSAESKSAPPYGLGSDPIDDGRFAQEPPTATIIKLGVCL